VNKPDGSPEAAIATRRYDRTRRSQLWFLTLSGLLISVYGNVVPARAQSLPPPSRPASTPAPVSSPKSEVDQVTATHVTGTIKGRVVLDDGRPATNASVMLQASTNTRSPRTARVDSEGRFVFDEVPAAVYILFANAPGYIDPTLAAGTPNEWPRHLIGAQVKITMIKGGAITGTITDSRGEPVVGVGVHATPASGSPSPLVTLISGGGISESDDRGIYRIYGLLPGQYTISAGGRGPFGQFSTDGFDLDVPTYYPSSTRDTAVPVSVRSGDATTGIDIKYRGLEGHSISGVVLGKVDANPTVAPVTVLLSNAGTTSILSMTIAGLTDERRSFSFNGIADGDYDVLASLMSGQNDSVSVGTKRVTVRNGDVTGIELRLAPLSSIAGTIMLNPIKPEDKCDKRRSQLVETIIEALGDDQKKSGSQALTWFAGFGGSVNDKGEFSIRNLEADRYRLELRLPTESWYVRAINLNRASPQPTPQPASSAQSTSATPNPKNPWQGVLTIKAGEPVSGVLIDVGQDAASLRGRVAAAGEGQVIPAGLRVHLIPVARELADNVLRYHETSVNTDTSFKFTNIAPGHYFIVSRVETPIQSDAAQRPSALDPTVRARLRREAETSKIEVELKPCQSLLDYRLKLSATQ